MKHFLLALWLVLMGSPGVALGQGRVVRGTVKGPDNDALPGVTVLQAVTTNGTSTNATGKFELSVPATGSHTLRPSFVGYVAQDVAIGTQTEFSAQLTTGNQQPDDVAVIGYGSVQRANVTGSVSSVNAQQIKDIPVSSAAEALTGRLAGVVPWRSAAGTANERITKGAVKALRARIALQRGGYALRGPATSRAADYLDYYQLARQECLNLLGKRGEHTLNPSFADLWLGVNQQRHDVADEIIFEVGVAGSTATGDSKLGYYNGPRLTASTVYGSTQGAVTVVPTYFYAFDSTDVRRDVTIAAYQIPANNLQAGVALSTLYDGKFRRDFHSPALPGTNNYPGYNWPLIRFADVLLVYAGADNELNGPTAAAVAALLEVRTRGYGGNKTRAALPAASTATKAAFFAALANERLLEFGSEGIRKYDLLRWNLLGPTISATKVALDQLRTGTGRFQNVPLYQYYKVVNGAVQWTRSFYRPSPAAATAPAGTTRVNWRFGIGATYVANLQPNGTAVAVGTASVNSIGSGLAAEYVPGQGKELLPIPQTTLDTDPASMQNYGY